MRVLEAIAGLFINTFGITQPTPQMRHRAAWFIFALLLLTLAVVACAVTVFYRVLRG